MKTQHTQGEWICNSGQIYPQGTGITLALIPYFDENDKEQAANAKLIAAAPELLRALIQLKDRINDDWEAITSGGQNGIKSALLKEALYVISKATEI